MEISKDLVLRKTDESEENETKAYDVTEIKLETGIKQEIVSSDDEPSCQSSKKKTMKKRVRIESSKTHDCNICFKSFKRRGILESHMRTHTGERPYCCEECPKKFTSHKGLKKHISIHSEEKHFQCDECGLSTKTSGNLKIHKRVHTGEKPYMCDECPEAFKAHNVLVQHKGKHRGVADFKCDLCTKTFFNSNSLRIHKDWHKNEPQECPECGMILKNKRFLYTHTTDLHPKGSKHRVVYENMEKKFGCKQCEKAFPLYRALEAHMKIHTGEKPYVCDQCPYASNKSCNLKVHKMIHTGETPFKCTECHKGYRELIPLKRHMLKIHGIEYKGPKLPATENQFPELPISPPTKKRFLKLSKTSKTDTLASDPGLPPSPENTPVLTLSNLLSSVKTEIESPPLETQFLESVSPTPPSENKLSEPLTLSSTSTEEELKGLSKLDKSVTRLPVSTIPCAKDSLFSNIDSDFIEEGRIKTEPIECDVDEYGQEIKKVEAPEEADGKVIKIECEDIDNETGENPELYFKCEESDIDHGEWPYKL